MPSAKPKNELLRIPLKFSLSSVDGQKPVDREADNDFGGKGILRGGILAQLGPFKSEGRGEFDAQSIDIIQRLCSAAPNGIKCRLAHPDESHDGVDKTLGRWKNFRLSMVGLRDSEGTLKTDTIPCNRGDLHFNPAASKGPFDMADYVMTLAETDPDIFSSSLVLSTEREFRLNPDGTPMLGPNGEDLPPLWRPIAIMACDIVSTGDAVDGLLSRMGGTPENLANLPNGLAFLAEAGLNRHFAGKDRNFVESHCQAFLGRYLDRRFGEAPALSAPAMDYDTGEDDRDGAPDGHDHPDDMPEGTGEPQELHNGARSMMSCHHVTLCPGCGDKIGSVVRKMNMIVTRESTAREPCAKCKAEPAASAPAAGQNGDNTVPPDAEDPDLELRRRRLSVMLED